MSRRDHFDQDTINRMAFKDIHRSQMRSKTRDSMRESSDPKERFAVVLAEGGYGIADVVTRAHVSVEVASMLVRGE